VPPRSRIRRAFFVGLMATSTSVNLRKAAFFRSPFLLCVLSPPPPRGKQAPFLPPTPPPSPPAPLPVSVIPSLAPLLSGGARAGAGWHDSGHLGV